MSRKAIHRGEILKRAVQGSDLPKSIIIKKAGFKSRSSYYNHIEDKDLPLDILQKYGQALGYDFSLEVPEIKAIDAFVEKEDPLTINQALKERDYWRDKYYVLLEKNAQLLEQLSKSKR